MLRQATTAVGPHVDNQTYLSQRIVPWSVENLIALVVPDDVTIRVHLEARANAAPSWVPATPGHIERYHPVGDVILRLRRINAGRGQRKQRSAGKTEPTTMLRTLRRPVALPVLPC